MKSRWNFILEDKNTKYFNYDLKENPFSSIDGTQNMANRWAWRLLHFNKSASAVLFMRENGRKTHRIERLTK